MHQAMTIWLLLFLLALGGWLAWEAWRGMARGEVWNLLDFWPRDYITRARRPVLFWVIWAILAVSGGYLLLFTLAWTFAFGLRPLGGE